MWKGGGARNIGCTSQKTHKRKIYIQTSTRETQLKQIRANFGEKMDNKKSDKQTRELLNNDSCRKDFSKSYETAAGNTPRPKPMDPKKD